ncbi:T9SS type A sorting domain-containing protein [Polaribacter atrinae]|uniref:T9SS type A sorting domain-containing protein n=1 Tax=Polaribacter atrinae TaxID=1333662 RepID=UPI00249343B1|nr:T9SS type A sorting domain-containing protein [Polaribacter atrinae]
MKKVTLLFTLLTISLSFGQALPITNGSFETGDLTDWDGFGTAVVEAADVIGAGSTKSGTFAGRVNNFAAPGSAALQRTFDVTEGTTYVVNFWFTNQFFYVNTNAQVRDFTTGSNGPQFDLTPIVPDGGGNATNSINYQCTISDQNPSFDWKEAKFSFVVPAGVTKARFTYFSNVGAYKYVDDFSIVEASTASVKDMQQFDFELYPNPARDFIKVSAVENFDKVEIYNLLGKLIYEETVSNNNKEINVSNLSDGIYFIKASKGKSVGTYKFIKQ